MGQWEKTLRETTKGLILPSTGMDKPQQAFPRGWHQGLHQDQESWMMMMMMMMSYHASLNTCHHHHSYNLYLVALTVKQVVFVVFRQTEKAMKGN